MKVKLFGLALLALAVVAASTSLADCRVVRVRQKVVAVHHAVATFVPLVVPAYSVTQAGYDPGLAQEVKALRAELAELKAAGGGRVRVQAQAPIEEVEAVPSLLVTRCASCHDKAVAGVKGMGLVLTDAGQAVQLDCETALACTIAVLADRMPKGRPLSPAEKKALADEFSPQE